MTILVSKQHINLKQQRHIVSKPLQPCEVDGLFDHPADFGRKVWLSGCNLLPLWPNPFTEQVCKRQNAFSGHQKIRAGATISHSSMCFHPFHTVSYIPEP